MTKTVGAYDPATAKMVLEVVRYLRASGFVITQPGRGGQLVAPPTPIYVRNDSGEAIPPFACLQTTGAVESGGQNYITVDKPADTNGASGAYLFNGVAEIEIGGYGVAHDGPVVRMLTNGSTVSSGDPLSPEAGSWEVVPGCGPFVAVGADDIGTGIVRATAWQPPIHKARWIKFHFSPEDEGEVEVDSFWDGIDPSECGPVTVEYPLGEPCDESDVIAFYDPNTDTYQAISTPAALLGEPESMDAVQAMAFDGCGINYIKQSVKAFPCGSEPSLISTSPTLAAVDVITGTSLVSTPEECDTSCTYEWDGTKWEQTVGCSGGSDTDCECGSAPTDPPGAWNNNETFAHVPCTRTRVTGLAFTAATVYVCASTPLSTTTVPISEACPDEEP